MSVRTHAVLAPPPTRAQRTGIQVAVFVGLLVLWWAVTRFGNIQEIFLPSPQSVVRAFWDANTCQQLANGAYTCGAQDYFMWQHLLASLQRIGVGVGAGIVVGIAVGLAMGTNRWVQIALDPYLNFLRMLPPLGYIGLLIVWFGIGDVSKVWLLFLAAFPPIALATIEGVVGTKQDRVLAAYTLGASRWQALTKVIMPNALPSVLAGIRVATGFAWTTVVAAELNNGLPGIGGLAYVSGTQLDTALTIASIIVIGIAALALDWAIRGIARVVVPWQGRG